MTTGAKIEVALIPLAGLTLWVLTPELPVRAGRGTLLLWVSALLLLQGLVRDLWLLQQTRRTAPPSPTRSLRCMCVESTLGVVGVAAGLVLSAMSSADVLKLAAWSWSLLAMMTMTVGFLIKDFVITWKPWGIRRERDHLNVVFTWKA